MFSMGMPELLMILAVALIVIGPKKLPDVARTLGRAMKEFRRATSEIQASIDLDEDIREIRKPIEEVKQKIYEPVDVTPSEEKKKPETEVEEKKAELQKKSPEADKGTD